MLGRAGNMNREAFQEILERAWIAQVLLYHECMEAM